MNIVSQHLSICWQALAFCFVTISGYSQLDVEIWAPEFVYSCHEISYDIRLDQLDELNVGGEELRLTFNVPITVLRTTWSDDRLTILSSTEISIRLEPIAVCTYTKETLTIAPNCSVFVPQLIATGQILGRGITRSVTTDIQSAELTIDFAAYDSDYAQGQLLKTLIIKNVGGDIANRINIIPVYADSFAVLLETSTGEWDGRQISILDQDLPRGQLLPNDSLEVVLRLDPLTCDIQPAIYYLVEECALVDCKEEVSFIDDDEVDILQPEVSGPMFYNFGLCDYVYNEVTISTVGQPYRSTLSNGFDVQLSVDLTRNFVQYASCILIQGQVNERDVEVQRDGRFYTISFSNLETDPDGPGGLDDLDGDGRYDDLAYGDSIHLQLGILSEGQDCESPIEGVSMKLTSSAANLCSYRYDSDVREGFIRDLSSAYSESWRRLPVGADGSFYLEEGDTIAFEVGYNHAGNVDGSCADPLETIQIVIPPTLELIEDMPILFTNRMGDTTVVPVEVRDSIISVVISQKERGSYAVPLRAVCPPDLISSYDPANPWIDQCIDWEKYNVRSTYTLQCRDSQCNRIIEDNTTFGTGHRVRCSIADTAVFATRVLDTARMVRVNGGWMDVQQTIPYDPDIHGDLKIGKYIYEKDTVQVQIPFSIDSLELLTQLEFGVRASTDLTLAPLSSSITIYDRQSQAFVDRCSISGNLVRTSSGMAQLISLSDLQSACIQQGDSLVWEAYTQVSIERPTRNETSAFVSGDITAYVLEQQGSCVIYQKSYKATFWNSEGFIPRLQDVFLLEDVSLFFNARSIGDTVGVVLGGGANFFFFGDADLPFEHRANVEVQELKFRVPEGFEVVDSALNIYGYDIASSTFIANYKIVGSISPTAVTSESGVTVLTYQLSPGALDTFSIYEYFQLGIDIILQCPPSLIESVVRLEGVLSYKDYYTGSLDIKRYTFDYTQPISWQPQAYTPADDFKVITDTSTAWPLIDQQRTGFSDEQQLVLELDRDDIIIDSVVVYARDIPRGALINDTSLLSLEMIDPGTYLITDTSNYPEEVFIDSFLVPINLYELIRSITVYTSGHQCGLDTFSMRVGYPAAWEAGCLTAVEQSQIVSYTPEARPRLGWITDTLSQSYCDRTEVAWRLHNAADGDMLDPIVKIHIADINDPALVVSFKGIEYDGLSLARIDGDTIFVRLEDMGIEKLEGLADVDYDEMRFVLSWQAVCEAPALSNLSVSAVGTTHCGEATRPSVISWLDIPIVDPQSDFYKVEIFAMTTDECSDAVQLSGRISGEGSDISEPIVLLKVPRVMIFETASIGGVDLSVMDLFISDDHLHVELTGDASLFQNPETVVDAFFSNPCQDVCSSGGEVEMFLFSDLPISCASGRSCERSVLRGRSGVTFVRWRPELTVGVMDSKVLGLVNDRLEIQVDFSIFQDTAHILSSALEMQYYEDVNGNLHYDLGEEVIVTEAIISNLGVGGVVSDTIFVDPISICNLGVYIYGSCLCEDWDLPISTNDGINTKTEVALCSSEKQQLYNLDGTDCYTSWVANRRIDLSVPGQLYYNPSLTGGFTGLDTLFRRTDCNGCLIIDTFLFEVYELDVEIVGDSISCVEGDISLSAMTGYPYPDDLSYRWKHDLSQDTFLVDDVPVGTTTLVVTDPFGCTAMDRFDVLDRSFDYDIDVERDDCKELSEASIMLVSDVEIDARWQDGYNGTYRMSISPDTYYFTVTDRQGCFYPDSVVVEAGDIGDTTFYPDLLLGVEGDTISIVPDANLTMDVIVTWSPASLFSCADCLATDLYVDQDTLITAVVITEDGCRYTQVIEVSITEQPDTMVPIDTGAVTITAPGYQLFMPNIIAPTSATNNILYPQTDSSVRLIRSMKVFDRWGGIIYAASDMIPGQIDQGWDGTAQGEVVPSGVYVYALEMELEDGTTAYVNGTVAVVP